jgi:hypothetical protein
MVFKNKEDRNEYQKNYYSEHKYLLRAKASLSYAKFKKKTGTTTLVSRRIENDLAENERRANEFRELLSRANSNNNANTTSDESRTESKET